MDVYTVHFCPFGHVGPLERADSTDTYSSSLPAYLNPGLYWTSLEFPGRSFGLKLKLVNAKKAIQILCKGALKVQIAVPCRVMHMEAVAIYV